MFHQILITVIIFTLIFYNKIICQEDRSPALKQNPTQITVSGNHPDAIENKPTVIYDNTRNIDLRSFNRPIKNIIPPSDTEEELFLPNEEISILPTEELKLNNLPETLSNEKMIIKNKSISSFNKKTRVRTSTIYSGTAEQNILLMNSLKIKPGWSKNSKWPDGTVVDDYSIVDWIRYGKGESLGISKDASISKRSFLYEKYVQSEN